MGRTELRHVGVHEISPGASLVQLLEPCLSRLVAYAFVVEDGKDSLAVRTVVFLLDKFDKSRPVFRQRTDLDLVGIES